MSLKITKRCTKCLKIKLLKYFYTTKDNRSKIGFYYHSECKKCNLLFHKALRNKPGFKEAQTLYHRQWQINRRIALLNILGGKCIRCGFTDIRALHIDHVNSNGNIERKKYRNNPRKFYKDFFEGKLNKEDYQILCANCNYIKRIEKKEFGNQYIKV